MTPPAATAAARRPATKPLAPRRPRRVSGPIAVPRRPARRADLPLGARVLDRLRALPEHRLLDRLIGGRVWIVLVGTLLVGIVTLQLSLLKLNAGIGHAVERSAVLAQENALLRASNSRWSDPAWVTDQAGKMGFVTPPQGSARFLTASSTDAGRALSVMRVPQQTAAPAATATPAPAAAATVAPATAASVATATPAAVTATPAAAGQ
jgi:hypothetical protein